MHLQIYERANQSQNKQLARKAAWLNGILSRTRWKVEGWAYDL